MFIMLLLCLFGLFVLAALYTIYWLWKNRNNFFGTDNRRRFYATIFKGFAVFHTSRTLSRKQELFAPLQDLAKKNNGIHLLEIGAGSGANLEFYPDNTTLTVVDHNPLFEEILTQKIEPLKNVTLNRFVVSSAENLSEIPDNSVDAVVSTLVLCSCDKVQQVYSEICRVLKPGAKFYFMEHVVDNKRFSLVKMFQIFFSVTGIWPFLVDGCHMDKDLERELKRSKFAVVDAKHFLLDLPEGCEYDLHLLAPHLYGTATAPK